jgi:RNA polymerase-binding transcription factor DksA
MLLQRDKAVAEAAKAKADARKAEAEAEAAKARERAARVSAQRSSAFTNHPGSGRFTLCQRCGGGVAVARVNGLPACTDCVNVYVGF